MNDPPPDRLVAAFAAAQLGLRDPDRMPCRNAPWRGGKINSLAELLAISCGCDERGCTTWPDVRTGDKTADDLMISGMNLDLCLHGFDAPLGMGEVIEQVFTQHPHGQCQIVLCSGQLPTETSVEAARASTQRKTTFDAESARLVHQRCSLHPKPVADVVRRLKIGCPGIRPLTHRMLGRITTSTFVAASTVPVLLDLTYGLRKRSGMLRA